jgi:hypothetical protein
LNWSPWTILASGKNAPITSAAIPGGRNANARIERVRKPLPAQQRPRCVGPPRSARFGLRAEVEWTEVGTVKLC